jgi:hypothetical protein
MTRSNGQRMRVGLAGLSPGHFDLLPLLHRDAHTQVLWVRPERPGDTLARLADLFAFPLTDDPAAAAEVDLVVTGERRADAVPDDLPGKPRVVPEARLRACVIADGIDWARLTGNAPPQRDAPEAPRARATATVTAHAAGAPKGPASTAPADLPNWFARLTEPAGLGAWLAARLGERWVQPDERAAACVLVSERGRWVAGFDSRGVLTGKRRTAAADLLAGALHPRQAPVARDGHEGRREAPAKAQPAVHELALAPRAARALLELDDEPAAGTTAFLALWGGADRSVCWGLVAPHARPRDPQAWRVALTRAGRELPPGALAALCRMTVREARSRRWLRLMDALRRTGKDSQDGRADDREL